MENLNYKNKNTERKFMQKNHFLELKKDVMELKDIELKDREVKIKREIELSLKVIMMFINDMDKFEQKEMKKIKTNEKHLA